jgi:putative phage-type endonuclease
MEYSDSASESSSSSSSLSRSPNFIDEFGMNSTNSDYAQLFEDTCLMMDDYIMDNLCKVAKPEFHDDLDAYLFEQLRIALFESVGETCIIDSIRAHSIIYKIIENVSNYYFDNLNACDPFRFMPRKSSYDDNNAANANNACDDEEIIAATVISLMQQQNQTEQRTDAWYARRHSMITASSVWKVFGTESVQNQLIYEKCKPYISSESDDQTRFVNVESPLHWGQKYEFLSAEIYQRRNNTRLGEFGCIQHSDPRFSFLGGSPDGINIDKSSPLFGRMVEIKNIVNREITGIPKEEYWIQMQIQMEVCDLNACDFVETRFIEYDDPQDYYIDVQIDCAYSSASSQSHFLADADTRGIIVYFINNETRKPHYEYMPFEYLDVETQEAWVLNTISRFEITGYIWIRNIYWKLDQYSCVLVRRNKLWFNAHAAPQIALLWKTIERERVGDYSHRAPKKRLVAVNGNSAGAGSVVSGIISNCNIIL